MLLLRYAIQKVTPVFITSMKHRRRYISNQAGDLIIITMTDTASNPDETSIPFNLSTRDSAEGFSFQHCGSECASQR